MTRRRSKAGQIALFLLVAVGPPLVSICIQRGVSGPDVGRTLKMRGARAVKGFADGQVEAWSGISAMAATAYQRARL